MPQIRIVDQGTLSSRPDRGAYMPSLTALSSGGYVGCQHVGSALAAPDNRIEMLRSADGRAWEVEGVAHQDDPHWAWRGPDMEETPDGQLLLTITRFESRGDSLFDPDSEALQRPEMLLLRSRDGGASWSAPEVVPVELPPQRYTCNKAGRLAQLSANRWMYPLETWKPAGFAGPPDQKAAAVFSADQGQSWGELTVIADDPDGQLLWWDQMNTRLPDGRLYVMLWTHRYGTKQDLPVHWVASDDEGRSWSRPQPTNLPGQVCCPIALPDGRVAAVYNHRQPPQGVRIAVSDDLSHFRRDEELVLFDAGAEAALGRTDHESFSSSMPTRNRVAASQYPTGRNAMGNFLAEHLLIGFGKPQGIWDRKGTLLTCFWCTSGGVTHTRWVRLAVD